MTEVVGNSLFTPTAVLTAPLTSGATSITVNAWASPLPQTGTFRVRIDNELMTVGSVSGTALGSLTRGVESTSAVAHGAGAFVDLVLTAGGLTTFVEQNGGSQPVRRSWIGLAGQAMDLDGTSQIVTFNTPPDVLVADDLAVSEDGTSVSFVTSGMYQVTWTYGLVASALAAGYVSFGFTSAATADNFWSDDWDLDVPIVPGTDQFTQTITFPATSQDADTSGCQMSVIATMSAGTVALSQRCQLWIVRTNDLPS